MMTPPDFAAMSPAELRDYAKDNKVDLSLIDSRRKAELVAVLSAWHAGEEYTPPAQDDETEKSDFVVSDSSSVSQETADEIVKTYSGTVIDDAVSPSETGGDESGEFYETDESKDDVQAAFDAGAKGITASPVATTPVPASSTVTLEQLELVDLVGDDNRVRTVLNTFPAVVNGQDLCRLMLIQVPGEDDTLALVWWRNTPRGPEQIAPVARVASRTKDPETGENIVTTISGDEIRYYRSSSCPTCGNRLANWRPWKPPVRMVQVAKR